MMIRNDNNILDGEQGRKEKIGEELYTKQYVALVALLQEHRQVSDQERLKTSFEGQSIL